jgi:AraC-like DNA-binding protein
VSQQHDPDWARYWRLPGEPVEAMHAHFRAHVYHRHSHETYSFGVTETGAQAFTCRGARHASTAGMVMAFNPDDPHDGHAATGSGFTYRMIHIGPGLVAGLLTEMGDRPAALPLFASPVLTDVTLARILCRLHAALTGPAAPLAVSECLVTAVAQLTGRGAAGPAPAAVRLTSRDQAAAAARIRDFLHQAYAGPVTGEQVAAVAGSSRHAAYRAFRASYGLAPSEYQRQLRLRAARRLLAAGAAAADAAAQAGFADQAHLTRWFRRSYGITPGCYRRAGLVDPQAAG